MPIWDSFLTETDKKMLAARKPRNKSHAEFGERPAVLVIDMNKGAIGEDRPIWEIVDQLPGAMGDKAWASIRHMQDLLPKARAAGIPVIYSNNIYRVTSGLPRAADPKFGFSELNPMSELHEAVAMQEGDWLVEKQRPSVFQQTGLLYMLLVNKIDSLIVTGNSTSGCVRATVVDAIGYDFKTSIVEECVFDRIEMSHAGALFDFNMKYGDVVSVGETYEYIAAVKNGQRT